MLVVVFRFHYLVAMEPFLMSGQISLTAIAFIVFAVLDTLE